MKLRRGAERGKADHGWLDTRHTFSFANYYDPAHMGFRSLRVINDDRVVGGAGFPTHGHRDMEIISYVVEGALEHRDSQGNGSVFRPGDVQRMTAGTGIRHSEYNHAKDDGVRFLQIWIEPAERNLPPGYEQLHIGDRRHNALALIASPDGRDGSVRVHQDVNIFATTLDAETQVQHELSPGRHIWVQVVRGNVRLGGESLAEGDGAAITEVEEITIEAIDDAELLIFDLS